MKLDCLWEDHGIMEKNKKKQIQKKKRCKQSKNDAKLEEPILLVEGMENYIFNHGYFPFHSSDDYFGVIEEVGDQNFEVDSSRSEEGAFPL